MRRDAGKGCEEIGRELRDLQRVQVRVVGRKSDAAGLHRIQQVRRGDPRDLPGDELGLREGRMLLGRARSRRLLGMVGARDTRSIRNGLCLVVLGQSWQCHRQRQRQREEA
jgi:hypothetical protein